MLNDISLMKNLNGGIELMFKGSMVALITPFKQNGNLDIEALKKLILWHIDCKTDAIVLCGTTGEAPTLIDEEKLEIFEIAVDLAKGKTKIIAGTGSYSTMKTKELSKKAKEIGVDGVLVVVPYYNKPPIQGLIKHYEEVAAVDIPIILYHHPGRTGTKLTLNNFIQLQKIENIVAVKEASASVDFIKDLINNTTFDVFSGDDCLTIPMIKVGAKGVISVVANIIPEQWKNLNDLCLNDEFDKAEVIYKRYSQLVDSMFLETNPLCIKFGLSLMNKCLSKMRLPLIEPNYKNQEIIRQVILNYDLI
jgi:4-hydroxy-tetrahydrodipicolinate synthase